MLVDDHHFIAGQNVLIAPIAVHHLGDLRRKVAQLNLWNEALYRWQKATELDPTYAAAWNNLAIAYEHEGQLSKARKAYEKAIELEPNNTQIQQNFELFKEINDRTSQGKDK